MKLLWTVKRKGPERQQTWIISIKRSPSFPLKLENNYERGEERNWEGISRHQPQGPKKLNQNPRSDDLWVNKSKRATVMLTRSDTCIKQMKNILRIQWEEVCEVSNILKPQDWYVTTSNPVKLKSISIFINSDRTAKRTRGSPWPSTG
jgi:hypothetical protein